MSRLGTGGALIVGTLGLAACGADAPSGHPQSGRTSTLEKQHQATTPVSRSPLCKVLASTGDKIELVLEPGQTPFKMTFIPDTGAKVKGNNVRLPNKLENGTFEVYFRTNSSVLDELDTLDLDRFIEQILAYPGKLHLTLEGFADVRGSRVLSDTENAQKNYQYSLQRIQSIQRYILGKIPQGKVSFEIVAHGAAKATGNPLSKDLTETLEHRKDRKVTISQNLNIITTGLRKLPADVYLLDATGSMMTRLNNGKSRWQSVLEHSFPANSQVYTFTTSNIGVPCPSGLQQQRVDGGTPFFDSVFELLQTLPNGMTVTILSDGEDNQSRVNFRTVAELAIKKQIKINILGIGTPANFNDTLRNMATSTGGGYYLHQ